MPESAPEVAALKQTERPHPLTPLIRGWVVFVAAVLGVGKDFLPTPGRQGGDVAPWWVLGLVVVAIAVLAAVGGFVSWYFTRFVADEDELRIETGWLSRNSKRIPFGKIQSLDVVQPLAARLFGLAELRIDAGSGSAVTLRYLGRDRAYRMRDLLMIRAHGERSEGTERELASAWDDLSSQDRILVRIAPQQLLIGLLCSGEFLSVLLCLLAIIVVSVRFDVGWVAIGGLIPLLLGIAGLVTRKLIAQFNYTLADTGTGLRITRGLTNLSSQSVPLDRIQGVRVHQPVLWRFFGLYRVDIDVLGYGHNDNSDNSSRSSSLLFPAANAEQLLIGLARVVPGTDLASIPRRAASRRTRWLRPWNWWTLKHGFDRYVIVSESGWLSRTQTIVPHARAQSVRLTQGPIQRLLGVTTVHVDTSPGPVTMSIPHLDPDVARELFEGELPRAAYARTLRLR